MPVGGATELIDALATTEDDRTVTLDLLRGDEERTVQVTMQRVPDGDRPVIGIVAETVADEPDLPFTVELDRRNIRGPSAGLMLALTVTDLLLEEDLTRGRVVAGTGTIARDGRVGPVSGVPRTSAATDAGIEVVGVETFQDALDALRGNAPGLAAPAPGGTVRR